MIPAKNYPMPKKSPALFLSFHPIRLVPPITSSAHRTFKSCQLSRK